MPGQDRAHPNPTVDKGPVAQGLRARHVSAFTRSETDSPDAAMARRPSVQLVDGHPAGHTCVQIAALLPGTCYREALTDRVLAPERVNVVAGFTLSEVFRHLLVEEFA